MGFGPRTPSRSLEPGASDGDRGWESFLTRFEPAYRAELEAFIPVARGETASPCTARDGLEAMRIAMAAGRSREQGRPIRVADVVGEPGGSRLAAAPGGTGGR
jgi:myo-inositol 2-dehydrogenase/D-chiro-inositol 1-dehydrogenase